MHHRKAQLAAVIAFLGIVAACDQPPQQSTAPTGPVFSATKTTEQQDTALLRRVREINTQLAASGRKVAIEGVDFFTIGNGRPGIRIHQQSFRWVPNDARRLAAGDSITYIVDQSGGATASGLTAAQTEAACDAALTTWANDAPLKKVDIVKRADPGTDITIFDGFFGSVDSEIRSPPTSSRPGSFPAPSSTPSVVPGVGAAFWPSRSRSSSSTTTESRPTSTATDISIPR